MVGYVVLTAKVGCLQGFKPHRYIGHRYKTSRCDISFSDKLLHLTTSREKCKFTGRRNTVPKRDIVQTGVQTGPRTYDWMFFIGWGCYGWTVEKVCSKHQQPPSPASPYGLFTLPVRFFLSDSDSDFLSNIGNKWVQHPVRPERKYESETRNRTSSMNRPLHCV